jgi:ribonuclease P protein component
MRVGLIVPRCKQSAVARNRLKRRLRELVRLKILPSKLSWDVVIRIRADAYVATFEKLAADIARAMTELSHWEAKRKIVLTESTILHLEGRDL